MGDKRGGIIEYGIYTASVNAHLSDLAHIRGNLDARAEYIKLLPADKLNEVLEIIMKIRLKKRLMFT